MGSRSRSRSRGRKKKKSKHRDRDRRKKKKESRSRSRSRSRSKPRKRNSRSRSRKRSRSRSKEKTKPQPQAVPVATPAPAPAEAKAAESKSSSTPSVPLLTHTEPRKSRWGSEKQRPGIPNMTDQQAELLILRTKIQALTARINDPRGCMFDERPEGERSPSPPPTYDREGKRVNVKEHRIKERLIRERQMLLEQACSINPAMAALVPQQYRPNRREAKLFIPYEKYPTYNFMGLIIGPRGNTQKRLERETGCKISIRGKGTEKPGKLKLAPQPGDDEEMHVFVTAESDEDLAKGVAMVEKLLVPMDDDNPHKSRQLRELATLNGNQLLEQACRLCGEKGHKIIECPKRGSQWKGANVSCELCGANSHPAKDCPLKLGQGVHQQAIANEYESFMAELTGDGKPAESQASAPFVPPFPLPPFPPFGMPGLPGMPGFPAMPGMPMPPPVAGMPPPPMGFPPFFPPPAFPPFAAQ